MADQIAPDFGEARRRLARATIHRNEMADLHRTSIDRYGLQLETRSVGTEAQVVIRYTSDPFLGTIFGEWLGSIRAVLDHAFYQLAIHETSKDPPTRKGDRQFPICRDEASFDALLLSKGARPLHGFSDEMITAIRTMQPFNGKYGPDGDALLWIHDLARQDRHRVPWEMGALITELQVRVAESEGHRVVHAEALDRSGTPAVAFPDDDLIVAWYRCRTEVDAMYLANGNIEVGAKSELELRDWYKDAHARGVSQNIRNDPLGQRMAFVEHFLGLTLDSFEKLTRTVR
ncbi:MAG: hypothetical protein QM728_05115 [Gordonia sp. (in: high G+C Gram-positive bacteria)]|uniref:hypothetical protein n=1 Tax=Gordonia sp. (in: high G+C Gram-positive bacteria) TaxID=84139 RepID=UPI0039E31D9E